MSGNRKGKGSPEGDGPGEIITGHLNADFDTIGAMVGASLLYPGASLIRPGSLEEEVRKFMKSEFMEPFHFLNFKRVSGLPLRRVILVDTRQRERLGRAGILFDEAGRDFELHIFDHHQSSPGDLRGDAEFIWNVGSTSTIMTELLLKRGIEIPPFAATILLLGVYEDTGFLTFPSTRDRDFLSAASLLNSGGDLRVVARVLDRDLKMDQIGLMNQAVENLSFYTILGQRLALSTAATDEYVSEIAVIAQKLKVMVDVPTLLFACRMTDRVYVIARSEHGGVNVGRLLEGIGGGGHATAASAVKRGLTLTEVRGLLLKAFEAVAGERDAGRAKEIMFYPVISVDRGATIEEAVRTMVIHGINSVPVADQGRVAGLLTRQTAEKALFLGLKDTPALDFAATEFSAAEQETPILQVMKLMENSNQKLVPVIEDGRLVGGITRTEILKFYYISTEERTESGSWGSFSRGKRVVPDRRSVLHQMEMNLPVALIKILRRAGEMAEALSLKAWLVGGFVRDILLNRRNLDIDIVVESGTGEAETFARRLGGEFSLPVQFHSQFHTASLISPDGPRIDIATARREVYERPAALPQVMKGSIRADLSRRDFTINSLAISLNPADFGKMLDHFGGERDLRAGIIRVLHSLSFMEDPTRILRAVRFEQRFDFRIGDQTLKFLGKALEEKILSRLSSTRLFHEFILLAKEDDPPKVFVRLDGLKVSPLLNLGSMTLERRRALVGIKDAVNILKLAASKGQKGPEKWQVYMMGLLMGLKAGEVRAALDRFGIRGKKGEAILNAIRRCHQVSSSLSAGGVKESQILRLLSRFTLEETTFFLGVIREEEARKRIFHYITALKDVEPLLKGRDLKEEGVKEGPIYSRLLDEIFNMQVDGAIRTREEARNYLKKRLGELSGEEWKTTG